MVKSYNRKGFGFIMCQSMDQDIYFSKDSVHPQLQTSDIAGESVTFEVHRFPDGKLQARNIRPVGDVSAFQGANKGGGYGKGNKSLLARNASTCTKDGEDLRAQPPRADPGVPTGRRTLSPHAGSRAMRDMLLQRGGCKASRSRSAKRKRRGASSSSSSSSSSRRDKRSKKKGRSRSKSRKRARRRRSRSRSESSSASSVGVGGAAGSADAAGAAPASAAVEVTASPEIEEAKAEALAKLMKLREVEPKEARMKEFRALLRQWHPDKNPSRAEVATAVFQFLQKGKLLMEASK